MKTNNEELIRKVAEALEGHRYDTMSQDSGLQCTCGSDSRFPQIRKVGGLVDVPWRTYEEHLAQVAVAEMLSNE